MVDEAHPELGSRNFKEMWGKAGKTRKLYTCVSKTIQLSLEFKKRLHPNYISVSWAFGILLIASPTPGVIFLTKVSIKCSWCANPSWGINSDVNHAPKNNEISKKLPSQPLGKKADAFKKPMKREN